MNLEFRIDSEVGPSGVNLTLVDIPELDPERNISLIDKSYLWQENVANTEVAVVQGYLGADGKLPEITVTDFAITNITTSDKRDKSIVPLYYAHKCRFHHYSYGENPLKSVYIADQNDNILKNINYRVSAVRVAAKVYRIEVYTSFQNNEYVQYRIKYNRTDAIASSILPSWSEILNAQPLFGSGLPSRWKFDYLLFGPTVLQRYQVQLPLIPAMSELINSTGTSFDIAPVFLGGHAPTEQLYTSKVTYTLKALSPNTFSLRRNKTYQGDTGTASIYYGGDSWDAAEIALSVNTQYATDGFEVYVYNDNSLVANDEAYFTADVPYGYLRPIDLRAIYLQKPKNVTPEEHWEIGIKNGTFNRRITSSGTVESLAAGGVNYKFWIPEYDETYFSIVHSKPYVEVFNETTRILDSNTLQLKHTPVYVDPSSVFNASGFPTSDFLNISVNDTTLDQTAITDWDTYNGTVKIAQTLDRIHDDVRVGYHYEEEFYRYPGYLASGVASVWHPLDLNPTPFHNHGAYASGVKAHLFLSPSQNLDDGTVFNAKTVYHNFTGTASGNLDFYLGSVAVYPGSKEKDVVVTDTRTRGGGLMDTANVDEVRDVQPESDFYWDSGYFDGKAFPSNGVIVITLPKMLISASGRFTEGEVREKVKKHMALGEYPLIDFT